MKKIKIPVKHIPNLLKIATVIGGGLLIFRNKNKLLAFFKSKNFFVTAIYSLVLIFVALIYRLLIVLNWIIQQAR
jgi:hypothetical protein